MRDVIDVATPPRRQRFSFVKRSEGAERSKYDLQLGQALNDEDILGRRLQWNQLELKGEAWKWERTGNIAIEYCRGNRDTGIDATSADFWVHQLLIALDNHDGYRTGCYLVIPIDILRQICRRFAKQHYGGGDEGLSGNYLIRLSEFFSYLVELSNLARS